MMLQKIAINDLSEIAPAGYYLALRVGFAFPPEEINALPADWVSHYTAECYMMADPVIRWVYSKTGTIRWSEIDFDDVRGVLAKAESFGLRFGVAVSVFDNNPEGQRSFGTFARSDREFTQCEIDLLRGHIQRLHTEKAPPSNLTLAELEALRMVRDGLRVKQIAFELGVSEGAVKQRLKNAKLKLGAQTGAQAAAMSSEFGLL